MDHQGPPSVSDDRDDRQPAWPAQPLAAGLYLVSTPIGNLRDITLRALDVLASADMVLAEDTRKTRLLLTAHGVGARLQAYHEHNAAAMRPGVLRALADGAAVALVSDAGTPLISDPGFKLVRDAAAAGVRVLAIPGASALLAGLVVSALPSDQFFFAGFPPAKTAARRAFLARLTAVPGVLVFFESGSRLSASLADMADMLPDRNAVLARELTKMFEEVRRAPLAALAGDVAVEGPPKGELVVMVGPAASTGRWDEAMVDAALTDHLKAMGVRDAAAKVAEVSGWPRRAVYARALVLKASKGGAAS